VGGQSELRAVVDSDAHQRRLLAGLQPSGQGVLVVALGAQHRGETLEIVVGPSPERAAGGRKAVLLGQKLRAGLDELAQLRLQLAVQLDFIGDAAGQRFGGLVAFAVEVVLPRSADLLDQGAGAETEAEGDQGEGVAQRPQNPDRERVCGWPRFDHSGGADQLA
jgi:hypothetical protein